MNQADIFYRALVDYRKQTENDLKCKNLRAAIAAASAENDSLVAIRSHCIIEEDWVNRIYEGLPFIEKALREERQFITQQGEVVPIEKAKRISKSSVEHLARHSDLLTHEPPPGGDIIPDQLYVVERLSDFAVYENRFLYMLLCYLRDFIEMRYGKIIELGNTYRATMTMDKTVKTGKRVIKCKLDFSEEAKEDPFGFFEGEADGLLKRIEEERHIIAAMLLTPLMRIVSKSPMLKPPITRTNVLRMNNNFKNALALYDYVAAYSGDGFRIETVKKSYSGPYSESMGDELAELVALNSFLVYEYGKELKPILKQSYAREEERRRILAEEQHAELVRDLKRRLEETGEGLEEYLVQLEKRNAELETDRIRLGEAREQIASLEGSILDYRRRQSRLLGEIDGLREESLAKDARMREREEEFSRERAELAETHEKEKTAITEDYENKLAEQSEAAEAARKAAEARHSEALMESKREAESVLNAEKERFTRELDGAQAECKRITAEREGLIEERTLLRAELHAHKQINGSISEEGDFSDKERFTELEREYAALKKLLEREWKKAKKGIRGRILWKKGIAPEAEEAAVTTDEPLEEQEAAEENGAVTAQTAEFPITVQGEENADLPENDSAAAAEEPAGTEETADSL